MGAAGDGVGLWEQDPNAYGRSQEAAWVRHHQHHAEFEQLTQALQAVYGVEDFEAMPQLDEATPEQQALVEMIGLRFHLNNIKANWERHYGAWPHDDLDDNIERLSKVPTAALAAADRLWGHRPVDEIALRNGPSKDMPVTNYEESRARHDGGVATLRSVLAELVEEVGRTTPQRRQSSSALSRAADPAAERARRDNHWLR